MPAKNTESQGNYLSHLGAIRELGGRKHIFSPTKTETLFMPNGVSSHVGDENKMERKKFLGIIAIVTIITVVMFAGCINEDVQTPTPTATVRPTTPTETSSLMVYSGAGMRKPMDEIGSVFEQKYGISVNYNYAGSNTLLSQIELTQEGDVYMPGATMYIETAKEKGFVDYEQNVSYHIPVIAVPEGNHANVTCLEDLTKPGVKVVLGDPKAAACGKIAKKILEKNGIFDAVDANIIAYAATVNELVVYTCMGTTDASIIWQASLIGTEKETDIIEIPKEQNLIKVIPIGTLKFSENKEYAKTFVDFVASAEGKAIFEKHGFTTYPNEKYE